MLDFIRSLRGIEGIDDISLTTNGVLLAGMAEALREAGIRRLNISLDSLDPARFKQITGSDRWHDVWRGIERAAEIGFEPLKINMVPVKGVNDDEIAGLCPADARPERSCPVHRVHAYRRQRPLATAKAA